MAAVMIYFGQDSLPFLAAAAVHEAGHIFAMMIVGKCAITVRFSAFGIEICPEYSTPPKKSEEVFILLAGPLAGLASALMLKWYSERFFAAGMALSFANMLPLRGLDGGSVYRITRGGENACFDRAAIFAIAAAGFVSAVFCKIYGLPIWMTAAVCVALLLRHSVSKE